MGFVGQGIIARTQQARNIEITNLSVPLASTEVSHVLQSNVKRIVLRARNLAKLQVAFVATESGTKYITVPKGVTLDLDGIDLSSSTIYVQSDKASTTVEILETY
jgi:hypothetical protein